MLIKLITILTCCLSAVALYIMMALLTAMSRENELPDLEDIEV
jgi:phage shock protein PspC (stress-responsive transcriptional regulator)